MKNLLKKTLATLILIITLTALSGCGGDEEAAEGLKSYDGGIFTIEIDPSWQIMTKSEFYEQIPNEALIAFTTPEAYNGFYINVNVIEEPLNLDISSIDFGRANINLASKNLTDYKKIDEAEVDLNGNPGLVHIFEARLNPTEKLTRFIQLYATKNKTGYTVTGAMPADTPEETRNQVGNVVTSFRLK